MKKRLPEILKRCSEPELQFATDEDTAGPDPLARRYDFSKDPLDYAQEQIRLINLYRERILSRFVKDGDSWAKARRGYELTLSLQTRAASMMSNWIGGAFVNRDKKGDPGDRAPVEVVPVEQQRAALKFVIESTFRDEAFGLTSELLERMSVDKWLDGGSRSSMSNEATWPIHDRVLGVQSSALTWLMNPTTLRRVYDNEMRLPADQDTLTLPELLGSVTSEVWTELDGDCPDDSSARKPMISSLRRNLQREHMQRLVDLILEDANDTAAFNAISNLARMELRSLASKVAGTLERCGEKMDPYSKAHLAETVQRVERALEAGYTYGGTASQAPSHDDDWSRRASSAIAKQHRSSISRREAKRLLAFFIVVAAFELFPFDLRWPKSSEIQDREDHTGVLRQFKIFATASRSGCRNRLKGGAS